MHEFLWNCQHHNFIIANVFGSHCELAFLRILAMCLNEKQIYLAYFSCLDYFQSDSLITCSFYPRLILVKCSLWSRNKPIKNKGPKFESATCLLNLTKAQAYTSSHCINIPMSNLPWLSPILSLPDRPRFFVHIDSLHEMWQFI